MKENKRSLKRIPVDSYQIINNDDESVDIHFTEEIITELQIKTNSHIEITNDNINEQEVVILICQT